MHVVKVEEYEYGGLIKDPIESHKGHVNNVKEHITNLFVNDKNFTKVKELKESIKIEAFPPEVSKFAEFIYSAEKAQKVDLWKTTEVDKKIGNGFFIIWGTLGFLIAALSGWLYLLRKSAKAELYLNHLFAFFSIGGMMVFLFALSTFVSIKKRRD